MTNSADRDIQKRILIVDDSKVDRQLVHETVANAGFSALEADNGACALRVFEEQAPDMVLLDIMMPELDGFEVCHRLRNSTTGAHTPVIVMTSLDDLESINRAYECGANDFVVKPLNRALLAHRIRYAFRAAAISEKLRQSQERLSAAQRAAKLGYWQWDEESDTLEWSEEISRIFGLPVAPKITSIEEFLSFVHPEDHAFVEKTLHRSRDSRGKRTYRIEHRVRRKNKNRRFVRHEAVWRNRRLSGFMQDITSLRLAEERIRQLAYYDAVTGLPNRSYLQENLGNMLARAKRYNQSTAVLFIDLDHFKEVNDSFGHSTGDALLKQVAERLSVCVRSHDAVVRAAEPGSSDAVSHETVVRLGGDEFVIVAGEITRPSDAENLCERVITTLAKPFDCADQAIAISASIGVSLYPKDGDELDILLRCADQAMYQAKQRGRNNYCFFDDSE